MGMIEKHCYQGETMDLNDTAAFVAVARAGSFTQAAATLGLPKGTVSRQVARLERHLGARLLQRTTRQVALTDVGRAYYERCRHAVEAIVDAERLVADVKGTVTGTLRVATSFDFGRDWLSPWLPELRKRHPSLRIELELSQRKIDLLAENVDVARKLADSELLFCASPEYLAARGTPKTIEQLREHDLLTLKRPNPSSARWRLLGPKGPVDVELDAWLEVTDLGVLRDVVRRGAGIGLCEVNSVAEDLRARTLRRVLPEYGLGGAGLWAVYPSTHHLSPKVRAFVDFVAELARHGYGGKATAVGRMGPKRPAR
jgi:DNA-binding transcriptional LysR family regulator